MKIHFKNCLLFYLKTGDPFEKIDELFEEILPVVGEMCNGLGVDISHAVLDDYEEEIYETQGKRRPILSVSFQRDLRDLTTLSDFSMLFLALGRLLQTGLGVKVVFEDRSQILPPSPGPSEAGQ